MESKRIWHVWDGRSWPMLPEEEKQFIEDLESKVLDERKNKKVSCKNGSSDRGDVTTVINALRCGVTVKSLFLQAPGLKADRLLIGYKRLEFARQEAVKAWSEILEKRTLDVLFANKIRAQQIMPIAVNRLVLASSQSGVAGLFEACESVYRSTNSVSKAALEIEENLRGNTGLDKITLGCKLYNPYEPSIWGDIYYVPTRVGTLMPVKITDLLEERGDGRRLK
jgi:hypothetical protein